MFDSRTKLQDVMGKRKVEEETDRKIVLNLKSKLLIEIGGYFIEKK